MFKLVQLWHANNPFLLSSDKEKLIRIVPFQCEDEHGHSGVAEDGSSGGYDPRAIIEVMKGLKKLKKAEALKPELLSSESCIILNNVEVKNIANHR